MQASVYRPTGRLLAGAAAALLTLGVAACDRDGPTAPTREEHTIGQFTGSGTPARFQGHATALRAKVLLSTVALCGTKPLPPEGGAEYASLLTADAGGVVWAQTAHAASVGLGDRCKSTATSADLHINVGGQRIVACFLMARAQAVCAGGLVTVSGGSEVADLLVNGQRITVTGQANQTVW
ncbi:MAG TPA: choice-of-anchor P family protein, partial [Candidatus Krumholzibacteria bacterium]|nr:choice-of-anchor P family protein [Candidatus Krumholzibacteria bacterium]